MKFVLVVTDANGKNLAFVSKDLQTLSLTEANERGTQIATEFYPLAKQWLTEL